MLGARAKDLGLRGSGVWGFRGLEVRGLERRILFETPTMIYL